MRHDEQEAKVKYDAEIAKQRDADAGESEIASRISDGRIEPVEERNASSEYRKYLEEFVFRNRQKRLARSSRHSGSTSSTGSYRITSFLFVTFNNAGGDVLKHGFALTVALFDEYGQATLSAVLVLLTQFSSINGHPGFATRLNLSRQSCQPSRTRWRKLRRCCHWGW